MNNLIYLPLIYLLLTCFSKRGLYISNKILFRRVEFTFYLCVCICPYVFTCESVCVYMCIQWSKTNIHYLPQLFSILYYFETGSLTSWSARPGIFSALLLLIELMLCLPFYIGAEHLTWICYTFVVSTLLSHSPSQGFTFLLIFLMPSLREDSWILLSLVYNLLQYHVLSEKRYCN